MVDTDLVKAIQLLKDSGWIQEDYSSTNQRCVAGALWQRYNPPIRRRWYVRWWRAMVWRLRPVREDEEEC